MRAWRVHRYGEPLDVLQLDEVAVPEPGPGELVVRAEGVALNLNDLERITGGNMMVRPELPYSPGMEVVGVVERCGPGGEAHLGRRVAAITSAAVGGYAELARCPASGAFDLPVDITMPGAAALLFPFHLAWLGLFDRARLLPGETVLVHAAAGGAGSAAVQLAKHAGARVVAVAGGEEKVALCRRLGADVTVDHTAEDFKAVVLAETANRGVDVVFDTVGDAVFESSLSCLAYGGRHVLVGFASDKEVADRPYVVPRRLALANASLCGVLLNYQSDEMVPTIKSAMGWNVAPTSLGQRITAEVVALVRARSIQPVVGAVVPFEELPAAVAAMAARRTVGRTVVLPPT